MIACGIRLLLLTAGAVLAAFPFFWMLATSLKTFAEAASPTLALFPERIQWSNYAEVFKAAPFGVYFLNTFFVAVSVTLATVVTATGAGYAFARLRFPLRRTLFALVLATMMIPFEITLIPNFVLITKFGWYDTYWALIVPWCASAFAVFLTRQAFMALPEEYWDAARADGCGHLRFLFFIATPLIKATLVTVGLFAFLGSYNSLVWPLVTTGDERMRVVQVGLTVFSGDAGIRVHLLMAASAVVIAPSVAIYSVAQRHFVRSALGSGLKG